MAIAPEMAVRAEMLAREVDDVGRMLEDSRKHPARLQVSAEREDARMKAKRMPLRTLGTSMSFAAAMIRAAAMVNRPDRSRRAAA